MPIPLEVRYMRLTSSRSRTRTLVRATLVATLALGLMASSVFAGKPTGGSGGGGKGKPGGGGTTATAIVTPSPVPAYSTFRVTGCGYRPGVGLQFNLYAPGVTSVWGGTADAAGCLSNVEGWANAPGSARLDVLENSTTRVATTTFTIQ
jgi:hypothetical protein